MHLPPLPSIANSHVIVTGDVSIDKSAAIAPGVILQADPDSRITIAAGVCIGMGAILHAHKGILEIDAGAILGAGVLVVGVGKIGANACIGAATTIWNSSVDSWQVLPAGSMVGETGRKIADNSLPAPPETPEIAPEVKPANFETTTLTEEVNAPKLATATTSTEEVNAPKLATATTLTEEVNAPKLSTATTSTEEVNAPKLAIATTSTEEVKPVSDESVEVEPPEVAAETSKPAPAPTAFEDNGINGKSAAAIEQPATAPTETPATPEVEVTQQQAPDSESISVGVTVYGQAHLNKLLLTLFPYKSATSPPPNEE